MASQKVIVSRTVDSAKVALEKDNSLSESAKTVISSLVDVVSILSARLGLNSSNSSKPPSSDLNRIRRKRMTKGKKKKPGGQKGHKGNRLEPVANPTIIEVLEIDH